jgi:hypothetical protein
MEMFDNPAIRIFVGPLLGALALGLVLRLAGGAGSGRRIAGAGIGLAFAWSAAMVFGAPAIPPAPGPDALVSAVAVGLIGGILFDVYGTGEGSGGRLAGWPGWLEWGLILAFGAGWTAWLLDGFGPEVPVIMALWGLMVFRLRRVFATDVDVLAGDALAPLAMLMMTAAGLGLIAAAANLEISRDLSLALAAGIAGFALLSMFDRSLRFGLTPVLGAGGGILMIAVRMTDAAPFLIPAVVILGFILFADSSFRQPALARFAAFRWGRFGLIALGGTVPIALAAAAALIGAGFFGF